MQFSLYSSPIPLVFVRYRLRWYRKAFISYGASNDGEMAKTHGCHALTWR